MTTPRLPLDLGLEAGERDLGRSLAPENSPETLPAAVEEEGRKPVERETLAAEETEVLRVLDEVEEAAGDNMRRWSAKLEDAVEIGRAHV